MANFSQLGICWLPALLPSNCSAALPESEDLVNRLVSLAVKDSKRPSLARNLALREDLPAHSRALLKSDSRALVRAAFLSRPDVTMEEAQVLLAKESRQSVLFVARSRGFTSKVERDLSRPLQESFSNMRHLLLSRSWEEFAAAISYINEGATTDAQEALLAELNLQATLSPESFKDLSLLPAVFASHVLSNHAEPHRILLQHNTPPLGTIRAAWLTVDRMPSSFKTHWAVQVGNYLAYNCIDDPQAPDIMLAAMQIKGLEFLITPHHGWVAELTLSYLNTTIGDAIDYSVLAYTRVPKRLLGPLASTLLRIQNFDWAELATVNPLLCLIAGHPEVVDFRKLEDLRTLMEYIPALHTANRLNYITKFNARTILNCMTSYDSLYRLTPPVVTQIQQALLSTLLTSIHDGTSLEDALLSMGGLTQTWPGSYEELVRLTHRLQST